MNLEPYLTNLRRMPAADGFPSNLLTLVAACYQGEGSVAGCADAGFLQDGCRPMNTKLLHPVNQ
jgi:hypothetical protein